MSPPPESTTKIIKPKTKKINYLVRWSKYLIIGGLSNAAVWGLAFTYLKKTPASFTSEVVLHVNSGSPFTSVNLPSIGQANSSSGSPFGTHSDPRENYKLMASGGIVLKEAAEMLETVTSEFGKPKVELINNTTLFTIAIEGGNPEEAQKKAWAIYQALYNRLNLLRSQEQTERNKAVKEALEDSSAKLSNAQKSLSDYKIQSGFKSSDQIKNLIDGIGGLQNQLIDQLARYEQIETSLQQLTTTLGISPQQAADVLVLQTDQEFQKILQEYTDITVTLTSISSDRGKNYPDVRQNSLRQASLREALLARGEKLLGIPVEQLTLERLILDNSNGSGVRRGALFVRLIEMDTELKGLAKQIDTFKTELTKLNQELSILSKQKSIHDNLDRDLQIAQAVFATTLTKIDLSKGDPFASFPMMQIIEEPTLSEKPSAPKPVLVMAGAAVGSILVSTGLTLLWWRDPLLKFSKIIVKKAIE